MPTHEPPFEVVRVVHGDVDDERDEADGDADDERDRVLRRGEAGVAPYPASLRRRSTRVPRRRRRRRSPDAVVVVQVVRLERHVVAHRLVIERLVPSVRARGEVRRRPSVRVVVVLLLLRVARRGRDVDVGVVVVAVDLDSNSRLASLVCPAVRVRAEQRRVQPVAIVRERRHRSRRRRGVRRSRHTPPTAAPRAREVK
eukprot:31412-Pelagococcus_subviridis.AAC.11